MKKLIEDLIIATEIESLANNLSHDEVMNHLVAVGNFADNKIESQRILIEEYKYLQELDEQSTEDIFNDFDFLEEENIMYKAGTIVFSLTTVLLGIYICII